MLRLFVFPALALASVPATVLSAAAPRADAGIYLVLAAPWRDAGGLIAAAGGRPVGPGTAPLGHVVSAEDTAFPGRAADLGLLVLDGRVLGLICGTAS